MAAGLATALLASACDTAQQVRWATYSSGLQPRIDAATATGDCAALPFAFFNLISPLLSIAFGLTGFRVEHVKPEAAQSPGPADT